MRAVSPRLPPLPELGSSVYILDINQFRLLSVGQVTWPTFEFRWWGRLWAPPYTTSVRRCDKLSPWTTKAGWSRARLAIAQNHLDALLVTHLPNIHYLCGFTGSAGVLIVSANKDAVFFTDGRYTQQAHEEVKGAAIKIRPGKSALAGASEWLAQENILAKDRHRREPT